VTAPGPPLRVAGALSVFDGRGRPSVERDNSIGEVSTVVVRVSVVGAGSAGGLIRELAQAEAGEVRFEPARQQVCIDVGTDPDGTLVRILDTVEAWLRAGDRAPTSVQIDDHEYVLGPAAAGGRVR
jgi:hypothetical protein